MIAQSTHWYLSVSGKGFTNDPSRAAKGEVKRKGKHDCKVLKCPERHAFSK